MIDRAASGSDRRGPPLVIEGAQWLAEFFFRKDPSADGPLSYDAWIQATQRDPERRARIVDDDITAVNRTMAARTSHETWALIINGIDWTWLEALDPRWDLFDIDSEAWKEVSVAARLRRAFEVLHRPRLGVAVISKVLHIKRPGLVPVLDSLVIDQIGGRVDDDPSTWVNAIEHIRSVGQANRPQLDLVRAHLRREGLHDRTLVRILDALLWTSSPGSNLFPSLSDWERGMRLRETKGP